MLHLRRVPTLRHRLAVALPQPCRLRQLGTKTTGTASASSASRKRLKHYHVSGFGGGADLGPSGSWSEAEGHHMATDVTRAQGGKDAAPQPVNLLLAALIGCETATASYVAWKMRIPIGAIQFNLSAWRDESGALSLPATADPPVPSRLQAVAGTALVESDASAEDIAALAHQVHQVSCHAKLNI